MLAYNITFGNNGVMGETIVTVVNTFKGWIIVHCSKFEVAFHCIKSCLIYRHGDELFITAAQCTTKLHNRI